MLEAAAFLARVGDDFSPWSKRCLGRALLFRRRACAQILPGDAFPPAGSRALFLACGDVPAGHEVGFNRWYDEEHVPLLARVPGVLCARRFRARSATLRYVALYDLADESVSRAREWQAARETEWARRIDRLTESCKWILRTYRAYAPA
ncbi:MAG: hypothetical protein M5U08_10745 [Burkholderiales bacterium]|nr:hypothetical protein [Burkholderiales bacterium]